MKRIISILLSLSLFFSFSLSTYAAEPNIAYSDNLFTTTVTLDNNTMNMNYRLENGYITYAEIGNDIVEVSGNDVYLNGEYIATVEKQSSSDYPVQPRTSWVYTNTCPYGVASDYTIDRGTDTYHITLAETLASYSFSALFAVSITIFTWGTNAAAMDILESLITDLIESAAQDPDLGNRTWVKMYDHVFSHPVVGSAFHKNKLSFSDGSESKIAFSCWA